LEQDHNIDATELKQVEPPANTDPEVKVETTRRGIPKYDGVYIKGAIQGINLTLTATRTIISDRVYHKIPVDRRPKLEKSACLSGASGQSLVELGKAIFHLQLGTLEIEREIIVATKFK
jgi:hypothetical protein